MKKIISLILVMTLVLNIGSTAFAALNNDTSSFTKLTGNSFLMKIDDEVGILTVEETARNARLTIEVSGEVEGYFNIDRINGTIYSSYTGKTIPIPEIENDMGIMPLAVGDIVSSTTYKISYTKIADLVAETATNISIAGALITLTAAAMAVTITTTATVIVTLIGLIPVGWSLIRDGIAAGSSMSGIKVVVDKVEIQKHQGGKVVIGYKYEISSVSLY